MMSNEQNVKISNATHSPLLLAYLKKIVRVDFEKRAGLDEGFGDKRLNQKDYIVCIIDELLSIAEENNWGLCKLNGFIYAYNGEYWTLVDSEDFKCFLGDSAWFMGLRRTEAKIYTFQEQLYNQFVASARLSMNIEKGSATLINLRNGTFEITEEDQRLREFRTQDGLTYQLSFEYNEEAGCPMFFEYLNRVLPNMELQEVLAEYLGYVFVKNLKLEKCLLLYGSGANGKSVFMIMISRF